VRFFFGLALFLSIGALADEPLEKMTALEFIEAGADCRYRFSEAKSSFLDHSRDPEINLGLCLNDSVCKLKHVTNFITQICPIQNGKCPQPLECARALKNQKEVTVKRGGGVLSDDDENSYKVVDGKKVDDFGRELKMVVSRTSVFRKKSADGKTVKFCSMAVEATGGDENAPYLPPMIACTLKSEVTKDGKTTAYCPGIYECAKKRYSSESIEVAGILNREAEGLAFIDRKPGLRNQSNKNTEGHYQ